MTCKITLFALALSMTTACTRMDQYFDGKVVNIDGRDYLVRQLSTGSYQAMPNDPELKLHVDAAVWGQNAKAIEKATGCTIVPNSVKNADANTVAAVSC